jgi:hypothetical protein
MRQAVCQQHFCLTSAQCQQRYAQLFSNQEPCGGNCSFLPSSHRLFRSSVSLWLRGLEESILCRRPEPSTTEDDVLLFVSLGLLTESNFLGFVQHALVHRVFSRPHHLIPIVEPVSVASPIFRFRHQRAHFLHHCKKGELRSLPEP